MPLSISLVLSPESTIWHKKGFKMLVWLGHFDIKLWKYLNKYMTSKFCYARTNTEIWHCWKCIKNAHIKNPKNKRTFNLSKQIKNIEIAASEAVELSLGVKVDVLSISLIQDSAIFDAFSTMPNFCIFSSIFQFLPKFYYHVFLKLNIKIPQQRDTPPVGLETCI